MREVPDGGEITGQITLVDGRALAWSGFGDPNGSPLLALHGCPDSSQIWRLFDDGARRHGLRLIAPDRPGFGRSDAQPGRAIVDWPADVVELLDSLNIARCPVVAISAGGAFAAATAWARPERISGLGLLSVIGPLDVEGATVGMSRQVRATYAAARRAPWVLRGFMNVLAYLASHHPDQALARLEATRPPEDRDVLRRPDVRVVMRENLALQFADPASIVHEFRLAVRPWGFPLDAITVPTAIWQGGRDDVHTPAMAEHLAREIPGASLALEPTFATFTFLDHLDPILTTLADWANR